jgi:hypothetical protein
MIKVKKNVNDIISTVEELEKKRTWNIYITYLAYFRINLF